MSGLISEFGSTIGGILWFSLFLGVAFLFGLLGRTIKSGVESKSLIKSAVKQVQAQGKPINKEYENKIRRQGNSRIFWGIFGILILSYAIMKFLPSSLDLLIEALFLIAVILGYHGIFIVPEGLGNV